MCKWLKSPLLQITLAGIALLISAYSLVYSIVLSGISVLGIWDSILIDGGVIFVSAAVFIDGINKLPRKEKHVKML